MNGPIARKGQVYQFSRYATPKMVNGQLQPPVAILNNGQPFTMLASIQPITGFRVLMLPEGYRNRAGVTIYTETLLQLADEQNKTIGDRFTWNGYLYQVTFRADFTGKLLNHYEYTAFKVENA